MKSDIKHSNSEEIIVEDLENQYGTFIHKYVYLLPSSMATEIMDYWIVWKSNKLHCVYVIRLFQQQFDCEVNW